MSDTRKRKIKLRGGLKRHKQKQAGSAGPGDLNASPGLFNEILKKFLMVSSDAVIISDNAGRILYLSDRAVTMFGGKNTREFEKKMFFDFLDEREKRAAALNILRLLREGFISDVEYRVVAKTGKKIIIRCNSVLIKGKAAGQGMIITTARDVTKSRAVEASLQESEKNYKAIFDSASDAIVVIDIETLEIIDANERFYAARGIGREQAKNFPVGGFGVNGEPGYETEDAERQVNIAVKDGSNVFDWKETKKDGRLVWTEISLRRTLIGGKDCLLGIIRDTTEKKRIESELKQSNVMLKKVMDGIISAMEKLVEKKDVYTIGHQRRSAELAKAIGNEMGLSAEQVECVYMAAIIHDIGKIFVSDKILNKKEKLTGDEYDIIKKHPEAGYEVLKTIDFPWPLADIILQHHERLDGSGYPYGLKGDGIYLESRIISVADVVEAITFERPYRPAMGIDRALAEIEDKKGKLYDPEIVDICVDLFRGKKFNWE